MNMTTKSINLATATLDDPRWQAIATRDAEADGQFFYSVRTTGVYCRPSCAARTPRPKTLHSTPRRPMRSTPAFAPASVASRTHLQSPRNVRN